MSEKKNCSPILPFLLSLFSLLIFFYCLTQTSTHALKKRNATPGKESNIQAGVPNFFEKSKRGFTYKRINVYDTPSSATQLEEFAPSIVKFISNGLFHGSVLVHCQHGVSRSTTCVLFYLMRCVTQLFCFFLSKTKKRLSL